MKTITCIVALVAIAFVLVGCVDEVNPVQTVPGSAETPIPLGKADVFNYNITIPWTMGPLTVPCTGDVVSLSGEMHYAFHSVTDGNSGFHAHIHYNPEGMTGTSANGVAYHAVGHTQREVNVKIGQTITFVQRTHLVAAAPGNDLIVSNFNHLTINANGEVIVNTTKAEIECK